MVSKRRLALIVCLVLVACSHRAKPAPEFGTSDGLPSAMVSGQHYTATFTVTLPKAWQATDSTGNGTQLTGLGRGVSPGDPSGSPEVDNLVLCSTAEPDPAGKSLTLTCPLVAPKPGPWLLTFNVGHGIFDLNNPTGDAGVSTTYTHTVS